MIVNNSQLIPHTFKDRHRLFMFAQQSGPSWKGVYGVLYLPLSIFNRFSRQFFNIRGCYKKKKKRLKRSHNF